MLDRSQDYRDIRAKIVFLYIIQHSELSVLSSLQVCSYALW